ncbi:pectin lyase-like protein [Aspergillus sclerotiicarbonarius CBS 121057]|uniref:Pectin lyase-like protein n=1 Tax=Aspergillus sclerotiicarbonarius (strain CBS 121057 / IBT 28362) TaxID=1448318 RepID=A0A319EIY2_ASPSB|nr:pectin lyase-like protein [Aspergillus sclerotiicarbonarius CBS 121057]
MVNNQGNYFGAAPDRGTLNGPITSDAQLLCYDQTQHATNSTTGGNHTARAIYRRSSDFWMDDITHGEMPFAPSGYTFYRNVMDYGATGDGTTDDTAAINRAISDGNRCGENCRSTTVLGALVYFPPGTYVISTPIVQFYYTQFVGDPNDRPNRNFVLDMTAMNFTNYDGGQEYVPTGIHWQVAQSTSMQNIYFDMPESTSEVTTMAVGIFMENGSGGFLSDLEFYGGNIGFRAGTQQYTARNLKFTACLTGVSMIWDWGFTWKNVEFDGVWVAFDCTSVGSEDSQGTGSIAVVDSTFYSVPYAITLRDGGPYPDIILDNLLVQESASIVLISGGDTLFEGSSGSIYIESWAYGRRYTSLDGSGTDTYGLLDIAPQKPDSLLDGDGDYFTKSRPQYDSYSSSEFVVATAHNITNDATGDQTDAINTLLSGNVGSPIFFPAGIYMVKSTVVVPVGSIIVGEGWSQIMGTGEYFEDELNPKVMVQVGSEGDSGVIQISDMLFTVKGPTAGAILMEWNVRESTQGSAGMWDSHFRVGGANGTDLQISDCPKSTDSNVWAWVADHDLDARISSSATDTSGTQLNIYAARGVLIESQGPTWFYGCSSEHSILYQYQLNNTQDIYLGHIQTETPYFQDTPAANAPYTIGTFESDPTFEDCTSDSNCEMACALQVLNSENIFIYSAGFYSFFESYSEACIDDENCQERLMETSYTQGLWMYNLFTIVTTGSKQGSPLSFHQYSTKQLTFIPFWSGYSTDISAWLILSEQGGDIGSSGDEEENGSGVVYIDPIIFGEPSPTVQCYDPCTMVMPISTMSNYSTITYAPWTTTIVVGGSTASSTVISSSYTTTVVESGSTVSTIITSPYTSAVVNGGSTISTTVTPAPVTTSVISFWPLAVPPGQTSFTFNMTTSFQPPPATISVDNLVIVITPPVQSTHYGSWDSTEPYNTILPTTVVTSGNTTQTFSEAQIACLATMTTATYITTTLSQNDTGTSTIPTTTGAGSSSSSTTVVPVIIPVTKGGFYWSPVPNIKGPKFPDPTPPGFPEIPDPSCFTFLGIFSIDCPPNNNKADPTTHYSRGANSPSCSSDCGTLPSKTSSSSSSSSSCTTQTVTSCRTYTTATPYSTVCAEYEGCQCSTKTVTDYQVSCELTTCTTTGSSVKTGCYVTEDSSTTGEYCVSGVTVLPWDEQADNGLPQYLTPVTGTPITTYPESVVNSGTTYTPTSGIITVGSTTISIPGTPVVIAPGYTGAISSSTITSSYISTTGTAVPGSSIAVGTATATSTSTTTSTSTSDSSTSSTSSTTSKTTKTSTSTTSTTSPLPTQGIEGYGVLVDGGGLDFYDIWAALPYDVGVTTKYGCNQFFDDTKSMPGKDGISSYPRYTSCTYINTDAPKKATGTLHCPDIRTAIPCPTDEGASDCVDDLEGVFAHKLFYCLLP